MTRLDKSRRGLPVIATELRREVEAAEASWRDAVGHAIRAGELLLEAKAQLKHGRWGAWLDANFPGSRTTATNYMRLARESATVADLPTVREAVAALARPAKPAAGLPSLPMPDEYGDDALGQARYWLAVVEHRDEVTRLTAKRLLAMAATASGNAAAALAEAGAAGLAVAGAEPWDDDYAERRWRWTAALHAALDTLVDDPEAGVSLPAFHDAVAELGAAEVSA
jgi:Protein of unknown function (DUF3102)